jgi:branched-subunit amino acid ABC-type transport system permease component
MLLFVLACGLSVTLGLMNFINLAHGAFAMAGGYCTVILVNRLGIPFALGLPIAFLFTALLGGVFERSMFMSMPEAISIRCCSRSVSVSLSLFSSMSWNSASAVTVLDTLASRNSVVGCVTGQPGSA